VAIFAICYDDYHIILVFGSAATIVLCFFTVEDGFLDIDIAYIIVYRFIDGVGGHVKFAIKLFCRHEFQFLH